VDAEDERMEKKIIRTEDEHIPIGSLVELPDGKLGIEVQHRRHNKIVKEIFTLNWLNRICEKLQLYRA
jgi:hypothetical protein